MARLSELLVEVRAAAARFEADRWSGDDCARLAEEFARVEKACAAARARASARAVACGRGDVEWVARTAGVTPSQARESLATVKRLASCPATRDAVASGAVSLSQAREIVAAEAVVPGSEAELLAVAGSTGMAGLREASRTVRLAAVDREELHRRQWAARSVRHWIDDDGMVAGGFRLPPEVGVPFVHRLDTETDRAWRRAHREGRTEARDAHAADAFVTMTKGGGKGRTRSADVVFVCSLDAYRRGHTHDHELCHVIGAGPVPVSVVRDAVVDDAFVKAVLLRGDEIQTVAHFGRRMSATLRTAPELGAPPRLEGAVCVEEGCDRRHGLEWDHDEPVANDGVSSYRNIVPRCRPDHRTKTERDRRAGKLRRRRDDRRPPG